jgi:hypothetical protein
MVDVPGAGAIAVAIGGYMVSRGIAEGVIDSTRGPTKADVGQEEGRAAPKVIRPVGLYPERAALGTGGVPWRTAVTAVLAGQESCVREKCAGRKAALRADAPGRRRFNSRVAVGIRGTRAFMLGTVRTVFRTE